MLKYFRQIRQNLINENKFSKYLLYAIGEIVLVVIGILIALQINNWNQHKQNKLDLANHLNTVVENLRDDEIQLEDLIEFRDNSLFTSNNMLIKYNSKKVNSPIEFKDALMNVVSERRFDRYSSGFERLEKAELYQSENLLELRKLIAEYDKIIEKITFWELRYNSFTESMEMELNNKGFFQETLSSWFNQLKPAPDQRALNGEDFQSKMDKYPSIISLFTRTVYTSPDVRDNYKQLIEKGKEIENEIKSYLAEN